ncbi:flagellar export chaperone FlgN [Pseudoalteromonas sp.]|uniref:flagellar export chaperone FlgN n=1 Tax=Pseudoalteromonas sp. TaxID=53249 RepID=UPI003566BF8F
MNVEQILSQQQSELDEMAQLLAQELDAIVARDHELLISVVERKVELLRSMQQRDQHIATFIEQGKVDITTFQEQVNQINQLLAECKNQNDVNQIAANQSQIASQKLKDILFGKSQTGYDKTGKSISLPNPIARGLKA